MIGFDAIRQVPVQRLGLWRLPSIEAKVLKVLKALKALNLGNKGEDDHLCRKRTVQGIRPVLLFHFPLSNATIPADHVGM